MQIALDEQSIRKNTLNQHIHPQRMAGLQAGENQHSVLIFVVVKKGEKRNEKCSSSKWFI